VVLDYEIMERMFREFTGRLMQTPPPFSAKHVAGVRAYQLARQQKPVSLEPVEVEIYALELMGIRGDEIQFAVECSGGTYVRSLAHDVGQKLHYGAHLGSLRRRGVAEFTESRAVTLDGLARAVEEGKLETWLVPLEALLPEFPELVVRGREEVGVRHGQAFELAQSMRAGRGANADRSPVAALLKVLNPQRRLIAVARHVGGSVYHPDLVVV
jgi:tRNA pseudouridine55 synthase